MNYKFTSAIILTSFLQAWAYGQTETYSVSKASFSSEKYDEFSPVYYNNGIVFCTNRPSTKIMNYSTGDDRGFVKIVYIDTSANGQWQNSSLFSKELKTKFNDGPVTFSRKADTIYYSRNMRVDGKLSELTSVRNKLGIFYAVFDGKIWTKVREFRINSEWYNVTTPWLSPDGKKLFFASDKPGGFGGSDIYCSQWKNDYWEEPVNLGPVINTKGNESYPSVNAAGEFFFSSDGHQGLGGKDIFFSRYSDSAWITPVALDAPVNSPFDDFGIITDPLMSEGFFSSTRDKTADIFHFRTNIPQNFYSGTQRPNIYCFRFNDNGSIVIDTVKLEYRWSFGDGKSASGTSVNHCFSGPGLYNVRLDILERQTGRAFFTKLKYNLEIRDFEQPYINSPSYAVKGEAISFDGLKTYLPGFKVLSYIWDFGDKNKARGEKVTHAFLKTGEYNINLELALKSDSAGNIKKTGVSKKIIIVNDQKEVNSFNSKSDSVKMLFTDIRKNQNSLIRTDFSAEIEFQKDVVYCLELTASKDKISLYSPVFRNVPPIYTIRERFDPVDGVYSYTVDQQMTLMATYPSYLRLAGLGFKDIQIKMFILTDPSEKELHNPI